MVPWALVCAGLIVAGCGGGGPGVAADTTATPLLGAGAGGQEGQDTTGEATPELVREVFAYRGSGRDPFISLLQSGEVRPLLQDLRVTTVAFNPRYPSTSVAVLRDTVANKAYTVRVGDELGRMQVAEIREYEVVLIVTEFGTERQVVLRQRRRAQQEGIR